MKNSDIFSTREKRAMCKQFFFLVAIVLFIQGCKTERTEPKTPEIPGNSGVNDIRLIGSGGGLALCCYDQSSQWRYMGRYGYGRYL